VSEAPDVDYKVDHADYRIYKVDHADYRIATKSGRRDARPSGRGGILSGDAADGTVLKAAEGLRGPMRVLDKVAFGAKPSSKHPIGRGRLHPKFNGQPIGTKAGGVTQALPGKIKGYSAMHSPIPRFQLTSSRQVCTVPAGVAGPQKYAHKSGRRGVVSDIDLGIGSSSARELSKIATGQATSFSAR